MSAAERWIGEHAIMLDPFSLDPVPRHAKRAVDLEARLASARVVFLGELNHFVHEKADFRLWWLRRLARERSLVVGEELGWSDGHDVSRYLRDGDESHLDRLATFGDRRHRREDRDDDPTGVFKASFDAYPTALFKAEQVRFYRELRALGAVRRFFGFDIDAPGTGYEDLRAHASTADVPESFWRRVERVHGESISEEADRLEGALRLLPEGSPGALRVDLEATIATLRYTALSGGAQDYDALRPAMAYREDVMKHHVDRAIRGLGADEVLVLMAHAFHLAKDDGARAAVAGVGPGGGVVRSLGHHLVQELGVRPYSAWMVYGGGEDSQPFPDLPTVARYPRDSLNARLARFGGPMIAPTQPAAAGTLAGHVGVGHLYNMVEMLNLPSQADAVFFLPRVTPLAGS